MTKIKNICKEINERYISKKELTEDDKTYYYLLGPKLMKTLNFSDDPISIAELELLLATALKASRKEKGTSKKLEKEILQSITWFAEKKVNKLLEKDGERFELGKLK